MNPIFNRIFLSTVAACGIANAQNSAVNYDNIIRQVQMPDGFEWDVPVNPTGEQASALEINPGGARFELHTQMNVSPFTSFVLDSKYVGSYVPIAQIAIRSEDTTWTVIPRTRADRPFFVDVTVTGLLAGDDVPVPSKSVKFFRHVQSYGAGGTGENLDRSQATLLTQWQIGQNGPQTLTFEFNEVPGGNLLKIRGEERFSAYSLADYQAPEQQLSSQYIEIWPVADGSISGITHNEQIRFRVPAITLAANDLYPGSSVYAQVYKGDKRDDTVFRVDAFLVPGSHRSNPSGMVPWDVMLPIDYWDTVLMEDGRWTIELVTETPFKTTENPSGIERLAFATFDLDRTIEMNGTFTTVE